MVAPLGSQPIQPQYTSSVTPSIPNTQPAAPATPPPAQETVQALPHQGSQNSTHSHAVSDFTNSLNFPKIISKPGQDSANSSVQAITQMLESLTNHPPQPSLLEPIGQKLSAMVDKLMSQLEKERQDLGVSPETAQAAVPESQSVESSAETASAEGPQPESSSPEADLDAASDASEAEVSGPEAAGAESAEEADSTEKNATAETETESAGGTAENSGIGIMAGNETVRGGDYKTQGDPNATIELKAMLEQRYATLFRDLIGEEAYQRLMEMLNK